ncbi:hypothetical protein ACA910_009990 [Epithemia clementina (nom. ined.)]
MASTTCRFSFSLAFASSRWNFKNAFRITMLWMLFNPLICRAFSLVSPITRDARPPVRLSLRKPYDPRNRGNKSGAGLPSPDQFNAKKDNQYRKTSSSQSAVAGGTSYASASSRQGPSSFEQRMRDALFRQDSPRRNRRTEGNQQLEEEASPTADSRVTAHPPNLITINSLSEYKRVVGEELDRVVAVRFHAPYCRACRAVTPAFYKLAWSNPDVVFVDVPLTDTTAVIHQGLRVPSLPFAHIYYPKAGLVDESKLLRKNVSSFQERLHHYVQGYCSFVPDEEKEDEEESVFN